jgi:hypothetical protein
VTTTQANQPILFVIIYGDDVGMIGIKEVIEALG